MKTAKSSVFGVCQRRHDIMEVRRTYESQAVSPSYLLLKLCHKIQDSPLVTFRGRGTHTVTWTTEPEAQKTYIEGHSNEAVDMDASIRLVHGSLAAPTRPSVLPHTLAPHSNSPLSAYRLRYCERSGRRISAAMAQMLVSRGFEP